MMQAAADFALEGLGAIAYRRLRDALYERLVGRPYPPLRDLDPPVDGGFGSPSWDSESWGASTCPSAPWGPPPSTVCLGLTVDLSRGLTPLLLSGVVALLVATAACCLCGGCCLGACAARAWAWLRPARPWAGVPPLALPVGRDNRAAARVAGYRSPDRRQRSGSPRARGRSRGRGGVGVYVGAH